MDKHQDTDSFTFDTGWPDTGGSAPEEFFDDDVSNTAEIRLMEEAAAMAEGRMADGPADSMEEAADDGDFFDDDVSNTAEIRLMEEAAAMAAGSSADTAGADDAGEPADDDTGSMYDADEEESSGFGDDGEFGDLDPGEYLRDSGTDIYPRENIFNGRYGLLIRAAAAAAVLLLVIAGCVAGVRNHRAGELEKALEAFADIGEGAAESAEPAVQGIMAVADARIQAEIAAAAQAQPAETEEQQEEKEAEASDTIAISLSSIQKDMKIKFYRSSSQSLAAKIPFRVEVTDPSGSVKQYTDDDMDGMIHNKDLAGGSYKVRVLPFTEQQTGSTPELAALKLPEDTYELQVREELAYQKVDVSGEIKSASEVNIAAEDTGRHNIPEESTLTDTVEWVDPSGGDTGRTDGPTSADDDYITVDRSDIPDPYAVNGAWVGGRYVRLARKRTAGTVFADTAGDAQPASDAQSGADAQPASDAQTAADAQPAEGGEAQPEQPAVTISTGGIESVTLYPGASRKLDVAVTGSDNTAYGIISEDEDVATVTADGTVTGVNTGNTNIVISASADTSVLKYVPVTVESSVDETQPLKDKDGNQIYIRDVDGSYREAYVSDYHSGAVFYRKKTEQEKTGEEAPSEPKYTGWQTIDDKTYYFDSTGKAVTGHQVIQGLPYEFDEAGVLTGSTPKLGIDVSMWNGTVNWNAVAASGIKYAVIRVGFRGSSVGALVDDSSFQTNIRGAQAAGLQVGVYFYSQAVDEAEAVEEASMVLDRVAPYSLSLPVYIDVEESGGRGDGISSSQRTANINAFCRTISSGGYAAGLYSNSEWLEKYMDAGSLSGWHIWLAQYRASPTYTLTSYEMWQYTSKGKVNGVHGDVDMNISYR